jgi:hypothetical protein
MREIRAMRIAWLLLLPSLVSGACSSPASSGRIESPAPTASAAVGAFSSGSATSTPEATPTEMTVSPLEGTWAAGPIAIDDIRASMEAAGITPPQIDSWVDEVGSPSQLSFRLEFSGSTFRQWYASPGVPEQLGEEGSFSLTGTSLLLDMTEAGVVDTYTLKATVSSDELALRYLDGNQPTPDAKAHQRLYTIAFYCSATFTRDS